MVFLQKRAVIYAVLAAFFLAAGMSNASETPPHQKRYNEYEWTWDPDYDPAADPDGDYYYDGDAEPGPIMNESDYSVPDFGDDIGAGGNENYSDQEIIYDESYPYYGETDDPYPYYDDSGNDDGLVIDGGQHAYYTGDHYSCYDYNYDGFCDDGYPIYLVEWDCWDEDWDGLCEYWNDPQHSSVDHTGGNGSTDVNQDPKPIDALEQEKCTAEYDSATGMFHIPCLDFYYDEPENAHYERYEALLETLTDGDLHVTDVWFSENVPTTEDKAAYFDFAFESPYKLVTPLVLHNGVAVSMDLYTYGFRYFWIEKETAW